MAGKMWLSSVVEQQGWYSVLTFQQLRSLLTFPQSCADTLAAHPDKYKVTIIERMSVVGGQATSISLDKEKYGTSWLNDGVQGGSPVFQHTFNFFKRYGHEPQEVKLQVAFGKGKDSFWTNCFPSQLVDQFSGDIRKFGKVLKLIKWTMPILGLVPIRIMLRLFFFSKDFGDKMVYPLIALFLGTGMHYAWMYGKAYSADFSQEIRRQMLPAQFSSVSSMIQI